MTAQHVVRSRDDGGEVGPHRERDVELLVADLARRASTDGEVRVEHAALLRGQPFGQTLRPPAIAPVPVRIVQPFTRAVAHGDIALETTCHRGGGG